MDMTPDAPSSARDDLSRPGEKASGGSLPHVVIVGAGFAGLTAARALARAPVRVTIIDQNNYHLFQPLLYQVATAALSPAEIAAPVRSILRDQANAIVRLGRVTDIDTTARLVAIDEERIAYDWLIVATGARHAYFGHDEWEPWAPGLKTIRDARAIRRQILLAFEQAENLADADGQVRPLNFIIIGGGPTGVEMAGAIAELAKKALARDFHHIDPRQARIILVEAGPRLLPSFPESLSKKAMRSLKKLGVEVLLGSPVTDCQPDSVFIGGETIRSDCIIWAAGVAASPAADWLHAEKDRVGRAIVNPDLSLPGHPEVFVVGDTALVIGEDGKPVPGVAPAAKQQGAYAAEAIRRKLRGEMAIGPFRYHNIGNLATIGRSAAVADFGWLRVSGLVAWVLWGLVHIAFLIGFRNRITVLTEWLWAYFTFRRGARLITD
ncbi:MAG: hypothetical protein QOK29_3734 [Rhodospirillaceae bacterium]|nr:hypothetical protein [Rhodospirillaceae bacterium]